MVLDFNKEAKRLMAAKITQTIFDYTGSILNSLPMKCWMKWINEVKYKRMVLDQ